MSDSRGRMLVVDDNRLNRVMLEKALREKGIFVSARGEGVRVSVSFFNNEEDIERLILAWKEIRKS